MVETTGKNHYPLMGPLSILKAKICNSVLCDNCHIKIRNNICVWKKKTQPPCKAPYSSTLCVGNTIILIKLKDIFNLLAIPPLFWKWRGWCWGSWWQWRQWFLSHLRTILVSIKWEKWRCLLNYKTLYKGNVLVITSWSYFLSISSYWRVTGLGHSSAPERITLARQLKLPLRPT